MKKSYYILLILLMLTIKVHAQSSIDTILSSIAKNNKTIIAKEQFWETKKLEFKTGLTPYNPKIEYEFLYGSPAIAGNRSEFKISQAFDFPTSYIKKKQLSNEQIAQAELQMNLTLQNVLIEAQHICIELVYRNKYHSELSKRMQNTEKWLIDFQKKLENGEGNVLDVNKAKLQLVNINASFQENLSSINQLNQKLRELNGGEFIEFTGTNYFQYSEISDFETLISEIETNDPVRKYLEQQEKITQKQLELSKTMSLPKFETGYLYQEEFGHTFQGIHFGISIPLWENKNKVKVQQANLVFHDFNLQNHRNELYYETMQKYEKLNNLQITLNEYNTLFGSVNNTELLDKSLSLGQISSIEYFMEMSFYYEAFNNFLKIEKEYHQIIAELYKYKLTK